MDCQSPFMYPMGWCDLVGHQLEALDAAQSEEVNTDKCCEKHG